MEYESHVLIIDGQNFLHRARSGFNLGDHSVVFNFFRNLRSQIELHQPTKVFFCLEGHPKKRYELFPDYKANRKIDFNSSDPDVMKKAKEMKKFFAQADIVIEMLKKHMPISVARHDDFECDDVIYNLIKNDTTRTPTTVVSNDSDFTQLLNEFQHVKIYNPMKKTYVETPAYDYVFWKALRGDGSDNIPGLPGFTDKKAEKVALVKDKISLQEVFNDEKLLNAFMRNSDLIKFHTWSEDETSQMTISSPTKDWSWIANKFEEYKFQSLLKEPTWTKFIETFDHLFG